MARRRSSAHPWSLDPATPLNVANARITLALMKAVRILPGAFQAHNYDDLGTALAPVFQAFRRYMRPALKAYAKQCVDRSFGTAEEFDLDAADLFTDGAVQEWLGRAMAMPISGCRPALHMVEAKLAEYVATHAHPVDSNVAVLQRLLGLSDPEAAFLRLAAAFAHGSIGRSIMTFVDTNARLVSAMGELCATTGASGLRMFDPDQKLARSGLLDELLGWRGKRDLDDLLCLSGIGEHLLATPFESEKAMADSVLQPLVESSSDDCLSWPHLKDKQALMRAALDAALSAGSRGVNFLVHGGPGTGKTAFVRQLAAEIKANAFTVSVTSAKGREPTREDRLASLALSQTFAGQDRRAVLVLDEAEDVFASDYHNPFTRVLGSGKESKSWMNSLLENNERPVIWVSNGVAHLDPAYLRRFTFCLEFPATPLAVRQDMARARLLPLGCSPALVDAVASNGNITPALLDSAARLITLCGPSDLDDDVIARLMLDGHLKASGAGSFTSRATTSTGFDSRFLNIRGGRTPSQLFDAAKRAGRSSFMFCGAPGTGKTQFAAELARHLGKRLVTRTASDLNSKWYGESERNVARMFNECDVDSEVLFLDEAEVLLTQRAASSHRADSAVTAEFLRWLEVFQGTFICATNHVSHLDEALMRRFVFRLEFLPLSYGQRLAMYRLLALEPVSADTPGLNVDIDPLIEARLAKLELLTPGDFANVKRRLALWDAGEGCWIDELEAEQEAKPGGTGRFMGFVCT